MGRRALTSGYIPQPRYKYVVQFSGGVGSFATALWAKANFPKEDILLLFCDTKQEDESLYKFLDQTQKHLGIIITRVQDGRNVWEVFEDEKFIGNSRVASCSKKLKQTVSKAWVTANMDPERTKLLFGIDWMEDHRTSAIRANWAPYECLFPLVEDKTWDKNKFLANLPNLGIDIPELYKLGFAHNNCGGFCVRAGEAHFLNLLDKLPERYAYHEAKEQALSSRLGGNHHILPKRSLYELRVNQDLIRNSEEGKLDWGGCGCFT